MPIRLCVFLLFFLPTFCAAQHVSFVKEVAPILVQKCLTCHNAEKSKGGYQVQTFVVLMKPGKSKKSPIVPGSAQKSRMHELLTASDADDRMPQNDEPLPGPQIDILARWINQGAQFDGGDKNSPLTSLIPGEPHPAPPEHYANPVPVLALQLLNETNLLSGGYHELFKWEIPSGKLLERITNLPQRIHAIVSAGGTLAVAGGTPGRAGEVLLVHGSERKSLGRFGDVVLCLAASPDGETLAAGGSDNSIRLYDLHSGSERLRIEQHADWVLGLDFSPDGKQIASASRDRSARVYQTDNGTLVTTHADHESAVAAVAFKASGKQVFSAGRDRTIHLWNASDGKKVAEYRGFEGEILRLLAGSGGLFTCGSDKQVRQYALNDHKVIRVFSGHADWVDSIALSPSGKVLASGSNDGEIRLWNVSTGEGIRNWKSVP